jgi:hypothetical protein
MLPEIATLQGKTAGVGYVATNSNTSEIETLILRLRKYGVSYLQLRAVIDYPELMA